MYSGWLIVFIGRGWRRIAWLFVWRECGSGGSGCGRWLVWEGSGTCQCRSKREVVLYGWWSREGKNLRLGISGYRLGWSLILFLLAFLRWILVLGIVLLLFLGGLKQIVWLKRLRSSFHNHSCGVRGLTIRLNRLEVHLFHKTYSTLFNYYLLLYWIDSLWLLLCF